MPPAKSCVGDEIRRHHLRLRIREVQRRLLQVGLRQRAICHQRLGPLFLRLGDFPARFSRLELSVRLGESVTNNSWVDPDHQAALFNHVTGLDKHIEYLAGGLRLDLHCCNRLDNPGRAYRHLKRAALDPGRIVNGLDVLLFCTSSK